MGNFLIISDAKAKYHQQTNFAGSWTVANFTTVMNMMNAHIFLTYANYDQRQYMQRYLRKPPEMKVSAFRTGLLQLNNYLTYFPPDHSGQPVAPLSKDKVKAIIYRAMPKICGKRK